MITRLRGWVGRPARHRPARRVALQWRVLRGEGRHLADALTQLRQGVPLAWSQIEDDDALATLSFIQPAAEEGITRTSIEPPAALREAIFSELDSILPEPKPIPVKEAPKTLAGFSERVQVLTQVEEDVAPIVTNVPQWVGASALAAAGIALIFWLISLSIPVAQGPAFRWIELRGDGERVSRVDDRSYWTMSQCQGFKLDDPNARREFISIPDAGQLQAVSGFTILYPRLDIPVPGAEITHTLKPVGSGISMCATEVPDPLDPGATVRLEYLLYPARGSGSTNLATVKIFQAQRIPVHLDVSAGTWQEVRVGQMRGIYWQGDRYRDLEGRRWEQGVHVLVAEDAERVVTIVAEADETIDKDLIISFASGLGKGVPTDLFRPGLVSSQASP